MIVLTRSSQSFQTGGQPAYSVQCIGRNCHRLAGSGVGLRHTTPHKISCLRSWWGWGPHDDSTKSWWLGSWLFIINMIIKIIIIIFVIIIIWFRVHGRSESVLCFVRRWEWRGRALQTLDIFITMFMFISIMTIIIIIADCDMWQSCQTQDDVADCDMWQSCQTQDDGADCNKWQSCQTHCRLFHWMWETSIYVRDLERPPPSSLITVGGEKIWWCTSTGDVMKLRISSYWS